MLRRHHAIIDEPGPRVIWTSQPTPEDQSSGPPHLARACALLYIWTMPRPNDQVTDLALSREWARAKSRVDDALAASAESSHSVRLGHTRPSTFVLRLSLSIVITRQAVSDPALRSRSQLEQSGSMLPPKTASESTPGAQAQDSAVPLRTSFMLRFPNFTRTSRLTMALGIDTRTLTSPLRLTLVPYCNVTLSLPRSVAPRPQCRSGSICSRQPWLLCIR